MKTSKYLRRPLPEVLLHLLIISFFLICFFLPACKNTHKLKSDEELMQMAYKLCENNIIIDSHIDWPEWVLAYPEDISKRTQRGDFDLERANKGGLNAALSVVYLNSDLTLDESRAMFDKMLTLIRSYPEKYPDKFSLAKNPEEIKRNFKRKLFSLPLCLENGLPIGNDLNFIRHLKDLGFVYVTLCHDKANQISDSSFDTLRKWNGLSPFGIEVIQELNRCGIMVDISHSTDSAVFQALRYSKAPVVATHSSCRHFIPGYERNLSDTLIKAIAQKNGVVMVNFGSMFLDSTCQRNADEAINYMDANGIVVYSQAGTDYLQEFIKTHKVVSDSKRLVDHIDHIVKTAGIDYVGLGSDFDGVGPTQPSDVRDVSAYPVIVFELLKRGYSEKEIKKILSGNFFRVWDEVIKTGGSLSKNSDK